MENTPEYRARYREYLQEVEAALPTERVPYVPQDLIQDGLTLPYLATFLFNPLGPTVQTISVMASGDRETPDLMVRRDLNPFAEPYQVPIGILCGEYGSRLTLSLRTLWEYLWVNGVGSRVTSREFLTSWPTAVLLPALTAQLAPIIATAFFDAARKAGLEVTGEYLRASRFGTRLWDRARDEIDRVLAGGHLTPAEERSSHGPLHWSSFLAWWSLVTSPEMVQAAASDVYAAWRGATENAGTEPLVADNDIARWQILFLASYASGLDPEEADVLPHHQVHDLCAQFASSQIRPSPVGWEIGNNEEGPVVSPFERDLFSAAEADDGTAAAGNASKTTMTKEGGTQ
jgi:hypothetical protein